MAKQPAITLLIKPASGSCNLRCRYCFYADEMNIRSERTYGMMSLETLDTLVEKTLNQVTHMATFAFQGGEPTLAGLDFYRSLIEIEKNITTKGLKYITACRPTVSSLMRNGRSFCMTISSWWACPWTGIRSFMMKIGNFPTAQAALGV